MRTKQTYIAHDDSEFETEFECLAWEAALEFEDRAKRQGLRTGVCHTTFLEFLADILRHFYLTPK